MLILSTRYFFTLQKRRALASRAISTISDTKDFTLWPTYFSDHEQRILLSAALRKLDQAESREMRRRRKASKLNAGSSIQDVFLPDSYYDFEEVLLAMTHEPRNSTQRVFWIQGHYDGVIHNFREMHLTSWPDDIDNLVPTLHRLHSLCPTSKVQTHLLHLASYGRILPHIDNIAASGSWILGVSLGGERTLRMEGPTKDHGNFDIVLPSGSVYLQRCTYLVLAYGTGTNVNDARNAMRYTYKHSIVGGSTNGHATSTGQRLSIMIRVCLSCLELY